jgi:hypothetical protein
MIMRIREELSPHLATLADIEKAADANAEDGLQHLARFIAGLIRDGAASSELREILARLDRIERKVDHMTSQQDELNTDVANLTAAVGTIQQAETDNTTAVSAVAAALAALLASQGNSEPLDLSGLEAAINGSADGTVPGLVQAAASVTAGVAAVQGLVPAAPGDGSATPSA